MTYEVLQLQRKYKAPLRKIIVKALNLTGSVAGAARLLEMDRLIVHYYMRKLEIQKKYV